MSEVIKLIRQYLDCDLFEIEDATMWTDGLNIRININLKPVEVTDDA